MYRNHQKSSVQTVLIKRCSKNTQQLCWTLMSIVILKKWHYNSSVIRQKKGRISKRVFQESKARQIFRETNISYPLIPIRGVRNVRFSENLACFAFLKHPFWDSHFYLITIQLYWNFSKARVLFWKWLHISGTFLYKIISRGKYLNPKC